MIFWELSACMDHMISKWKWKWSLIKRASQTFSLSLHDNELRDLTSLRRPAFSFSLSVLRQAFVAVKHTWCYRLKAWCLPPFGKDGGSRQERWDWGRGSPWAQPPAQTLIYTMLTDVILLQSFMLCFSFSFWSRQISPGRASEGWQMPGYGWPTCALWVIHTRASYQCLLNPFLWTV